MVKKSLLWVYRVTLLALWLVIIVLTVSVIALRYVILPHIGDYKDQIAQQISTAVGQKVSIGRIQASWHGLNPHLSLFDLDLYDQQQRAALRLGHIETSLSWLSIPLLDLRLSSLTIYQPELTIRREADGTLYVAGMSMSGPARPEFPNWILKQSQIDVIGANVLWQDDLRQAPPLSLTQLNLQIVSPAWESLIGHHRFGLRATPSAGSSRPIDLRGDLYGRDVARIKDWRGELYARLEGTNIAAWRTWVDLPIALTEGTGAAQLWLEIADGKATHVTSDVILNNLKTRLSKNMPEAALRHVSGRLKWEQLSDGQQVSGERMRLIGANGMNMQDGKFKVSQRSVAGKLAYAGNVQLDQVQLESLRAFTSYLPLPADSKQRIADLAPVGRLSNLQLSWQGDGQGIPAKYALRSQFAGLGIQAYEQIPGFSNLGGNLDADENGGTLSLNSQGSELDFAKVLRWPVPADRLSGQVKWRLASKQTEVKVNNLAISSPHLAGTVTASYLHSPGKSGFIDLKGKLTRADGKFARFYFPKVLSEHTLHWLDTAILAGRGEDVNVTVKGYLSEFPFANSKQGLFRITAKVADGVLDYAAGWPQINGIKLDMLFEGNRMELNANAGNLLGNQILKAKVAIPALHAPQPVLSVVGETQGPVSEGIKYINSSPLISVMRGFTDNLKTSGNGKLSLDLSIPLHDTQATKVKGAYVVSNGSMLAEGVPELSKLNGRLEFTETSLRTQNANAWVYGGPAQFSLNTGKDHVIRINAHGRVTDIGLRQAYGGGLADRIRGYADWTGNINIFDKQLDIAIASNLLGMSSSLPAPLAKSATETLALRIDKKQPSPALDNISISLGNILSGKFQRTLQQDTFKLERGEIGLNQVAELPSQPGIGLRGNIDYLDLDEWQAIMESASADAGGNGNGAKSTLPLGRVELAVNTLDVVDRRINALKLNARHAGDGWRISMQSREITGDAQWHSADGTNGSGKLSAQLKNLIVPAAATTTSELRTQGNYTQQPKYYPALDITADNFEVGKKKLGRLELQASEQNDDWSIEKLRIINPDSTLEAEGEWHNWKRNPNTRITLSWDIKDLGKTLDRFGYPNTIKAGNADLTGQLKWPGSPHEFNIPGLSGNLQLDARKGQILKIQPGVGRLFSVLSLQNLPRRLTFDFRDVFSSGFTFDKISASVRIERGTMRSDDFRMEGPTALVEMRGDTDLQKETQHLNVKVTPYISDSLSLAALAGGPVVGAAAYIAQKLLKDPIDKLAADEYEIGGTWDNPQELKVGSKPATAPTPLPGNSPLGK